MSKRHEAILRTAFDLLLIQSIAIIAVCYLSDVLWKNIVGYCYTIFLGIVIYLSNYAQIKEANHEND